MTKDSVKKLIKETSETVQIHDFALTFKSYGLEPDWEPDDDEFDSWSLMYGSEQRKDDRDLVLEIVERDGAALEYASECF